MGLSYIILFHWSQLQLSSSKGVCHQDGCHASRLTIGKLYPENQTNDHGKTIYAFRYSKEKVSIHFPIVFRSNIIYLFQIKLKIYSSIIYCIVC